MNSKIGRFLTTCIAMMVPPSVVMAQGTFSNLDFESPVLPLIPNPLYQVPISNALPAWSGFIGGVQVEWVVYNTISLAAPAISVHGPGSLEPVLQGEYRVYLQAGYTTDHELARVAIAQTGVIPSTALSLRYYAAKGNPEVWFAGRLLPTVLLAEVPNGPATYAADVSQLAGQVGELRFWGTGIIDNIQFSATPIPEPFAAALFGVGSAIVAWVRRRRRNSRTADWQGASKSTRPRSGRF